MAIYVTDGSTAKKRGGYIQSKTFNMNPTNAAQNGDTDNNNFTASGITSCSVNMGVPASTNSIFIITGEAQLHTDTSPPGGATDAGGYSGLGIQASTDGGSNWFELKDQGRWAEGMGFDHDHNTRMNIFARHRPNTTGTVVYRMTWSSHRQKVYVSRIPTSNNGGTTSLHVVEYDNGETS